MKLKSYDMDTIIKKELYFLIPFYIIRYKNKYSKEYNQEIMEGQILAGMEEILGQFYQFCQKNGNLDLFYDIRELTQVIGKHLIEGSQNREEVDNMGRGKILELPSDRIRAAEARADKEKDRADKAEAKVEAEKTRADAEKTRADANEIKIKILEERLRQYGEDPDLLCIN